VRVRVDRDGRIDGARGASDDDIHLVSPLSIAKPHVCAPIDANGNLTADGAKSYFWNALNQLVEVKEGTTTIATFEYDGAGRRTEKVAAGLTHQYIYDAEDIVEERISGSSSDTIRYYHGAGIDEPLARKNSSDVVTYYLADHLGSIIQESSAAGAITLEREYDPWGVAMQGASTSGYAYTGREWDAETGLYYYRARYFSAAAGKFISEDPIGFSGGSNFFGYVAGAPTRLIDPYGLDAVIRTNGRDVTITIPITFIGGTTGDVIRTIDAIEQYWTGQFGDFNVVTKVVSGDANQMYLVPDYARGFTWNENTAIVPTKQNPWVAAHEAGHLMGLPDKYDSSGPFSDSRGNIMAEFFGRPNGNDILTLGSTCRRPR
jgi:RHS repeat-associated protein